MPVRLYTLVCPVVLALLFWSAGQASAQQSEGPDVYRLEAQAMGATLVLTVYTDSPSQAQALLAEVQAEVEALEQTLSTYRPTSLVSRLNAQAAHEAVPVTPTFLGLLERSLALSWRTGGAFDVTVGRLVEAWGFRKGTGQVPDAETLAGARRQVGWQHVTLDAERRTVRFEQPGLLLDFGANGKGLALDRAQRRLRAQGVTAALLVFGGSSIYALGAPPQADGWTVEVPGLAAPVRLRDAALATSGGAHRFFVQDGTRYIHIFDPRTGRPVDGRVQATVAALTAEAADALATAAFVLGPEASRPLLASAGACALFLEGVPEQTMPVQVVPPAAVPSVTVCPFMP